MSAASLGPRGRSFSHGLVASLHLLGSAASLVAKADMQDSAQPGEIRFESVDQIVTDQITRIDSEFYDNRLLLEIYNNL